MYYCDICDNNYDNKAVYMKHLYKEIDTKHKLQLIALCQEEINLLHNDIKLLDVFIKRGRRYYKIYNNTCKHESIIRWDGLRNRACANALCTNKNKSIATKGKSKSYLHRQHIKEAQNRDSIKEMNRERTTNLWKDKDFRDKTLQAQYDTRMKHALNIAKNQRKKANKDELLFLDLLESNNYYVNRSLKDNDMWQVPYINDEVEYIFDFYIRELDLYINIDGDIHRNIPAVKSRDDLQDEYCKQHNIKLKRLNESTLSTFLKGGGVYA